jgi:drug/metabolite transporter (DMT)-like permease
MISNEIKGYILVGLSGLFYGLVGYFGYHALESSPNVANMLFWRFLISAVFIGLFMLPKISQMRGNLSVMLRVFSAGALFYIASTFAYFSAISQIGTGIAMAIFFTYPAMVVLCNWLLYKIKVGREYIMALVMIFLGLMLLIELKLGFHIQGVILSLISAAGYAFYIIAGKKNSELNPLLSSCLVSAGCAFTACVIALFQGEFFMPMDQAFWVNTFGLGILSTAVPILLLFQGLKYISSEKAAVLGVLEPVFVAITGVLLLGENLAVMQIIGLIILLTGALVALRTRPV